MHKYIRALLGAIVALVAVHGNMLPAHGHGDEDHGDAAPSGATAAAGSQGETLTSEGVSDYFEVVAKYPATDAGDDVRMRLYIADFATNRPIVDAALALSFKPGGVKIKQAPTMIAAGIYDGVFRFPGDGTYAMVMTVTDGQRTDFVEVRDIHAGASAHKFLAEHASDAPAQEHGEDGMTAPAIALIAAAILAALGVAIVVRRRRSSETTSGTVSRDPELSSDPSPTNES